MSVYDLHSQISGVESKLVQRIEALESRLAEMEDYIQGKEMKTQEKRIVSLEKINGRLEKVLLSQHHFFATFRSEAEFLRNEIKIYLENQAACEKALFELLQKAVSVFDNLQECARPVYHCIERQIKERRNESRL